MNKQAIRRIVLAQIASDGGKGITDLLDVMPQNLMPSAQKAWGAGYAVKDILAMQACKIICRSKDKDIRFFVTYDKSHVALYIIYFDVVIDGQRNQVSFHSFSTGWEKFTRGSTGSMGRWDHKSSRATCEKLVYRFLA